MAQGEGELAHVTLLKALYDLGNGEPGRFFEYGRLFEVVGLTFDELIGATKQLIGERLIDPTFSDKVIGLTPAGVAAWEALLSERDGEPSAVAQTDLDGPRSTQRLSSILFLDIHGWSKLNQRGVVQYVSQVLPKVGQLLEDNAAKNVNTWGDAIVATFDSSDVAAKTALAIQRFFADGVVAFPAGIRCRISLNFGDVVMQFNPLTKRDDIFGNAVHLAARLEPATTPGYVFCTERFAKSLSAEGSKAWPLAELVSLPKGYGDVRACVVTDQNAPDPRPGLERIA